MKNAKTTSIFIIFSIAIVVFYGCNFTAKKLAIITKVAPVDKKTADGFIPALYGNQSMQSLIYIDRKSVV